MWYRLVNSNHSAAVYAQVRVLLAGGTGLKIASRVRVEPFEYCLFVSSIKQPLVVYRILAAFQDLVNLTYTDYLI